MYLAFADKIYEGKPNAERTEWEFNEIIQGGINDAYPEDVNLSQIDITVKKGTDLSTGDTITIKIPASLIPMRSYNVDVDKKTLDISDTYPLRLFYGVSVKDDVIAALNNPGDNSETYSQIMSSQKDGDDISFYSNSFVKDSNKGSTIATFTPSNGNSFYYYPVNTQLYTNVTCETKATRSNISGESTLYYQDSYWELTGNGNNAEQKTVVESISRLGQDWSNVRYDDDGNAYIAQHAQRLDRPSTLVDPKDQDGNKTGTASNVLYPEWGSDMVSQYLGNNGKISYPAPGQLEIKKTVNWGNASEETKTTKNSFDFSVKLFTVDGEGNKDDLTGSYLYAIYENGQDPIEGGTGTVSNGDTITLKAGQRVIISGLPDGAKFEVTETNANKNGFTTTDEYAGASQDANKEDGKVEGTIEKGAQQSVSFTNTYNAQSVNLGEDHSFKVEKVLGGRDWRSTDEFSFILTGISSTGSTGDIPMPKLTRIEITEDDLDQSMNKYIDTFEDIEFKEPGRYRYRIDEDSDSSPIPGINYSDAIYRATVNVTDDGMGNLQIDSVLIELMYDDDGNSHVTDGVGEEDTDGIMTFTNKYDVSSITEGIQGKKIYDDTTGDNLIEAGKFTFQLEAKGGYVTGSGSAENLSISADETPMPQGAQENKITTGNVGDRFTFEDIPFNGDHVGNTYVYEVSEVAGTEDGMIYDTSTKHTIEIQVTEEEIENDPGHYHIVATVLGDAANPDNVAFTNTYDPNDVTLTGDSAIHGTKVLDGRDIKDDESFYFQLKQTGGSTVLDIPEIVEVNKTTGMDFGFSNLTFSKVGTYTFEVIEVADINGTELQNGNGMTYSDNVATVTVEVKDNYDGTLGANVTYKNSHSQETTEAVFTNVYNASMNYGSEGAGGIKITKQMLDRPMNNNEFEFKITGLDDAKDLITKDDESFKNTAAGMNQVISMSKLQSLTFDQDDAGKTYSFIVDEVEPEEAEKLAGVTYDQSQYRVDIQVFDNGNGTMHTLTTVTKIKDSQGNDVNDVVINQANSDDTNYVVPTFGFVNDYNPNPAEIGEDADSALQVVKQVRGADSPDGVSYGFTLTATGDNVTNIEGLDDNNQLFVSTNGVIKAGDSQTLSFDKLTFNEPGTYTFTVQESNPVADDGWTFDTNPKTVTVTVTDLNTDGVYDGNLYISGITGNPVIVRNRYEANSVVVGDDETDLQVTKEVVGAPATEEFEFVLTLTSDNAENVEGLSDEGTIVQSTTALTGNENSETVNFGDLTFTKVGTYTFDVEEKTTTNAKGWSYDNTVKTITVEVTDDGNDGQLDATVVDNNPTIQNKYDAQSISTGSDTLGNPMVTKEVTGAPATEEFEFELTLTSDNAENVEGLNGEGAIVKSTTGLNGNEDTETVDFGQLTFKEVGDYVFTVREITTTNKAGWTYDNDSRTITYHVTDTDHDGYLEATVEDNNPIVTNSYIAQSVVLDGETALKVTKKVTGANALSEFSFELALTSNNADGVTGLVDNKLITTTTALIGTTNSETANFGPLAFTKTGEYIFSVKETTTKPENANGWLYDDSVKTITVNVTDDNHDGQLDAEVIDNNPIFTNKYDAEDVTIGTDGEAGIIVQKTLAGRAWEANDSFEFEISAVTEGAPLPEAKTISLSGTEGTNDAVTNTFGSITYTKDMLDGAMSKDFVYTITETSTGGNGVVVDSAKERTVTVTITDDASGALSATISYDNSAASSESDRAVTTAAAFTNTYDASASTGIPTNFTLKKVFTGHEWTEDYAFQFKLTPVNGAPMPETNEANGVIIDAEGNAIKTVTGPQTTGETTFDFGAITYDQAGEYVYTVTEIQGDNAGIEYSRNIAEVTVTVTDKGESGSSTGKLVASTSVKNSAFKNTYSSELDYVGKGGIELVKNLTGYDLTKDNQFTFTLSAADVASKEKAGMQDMSEDVFNTEDTMDANGLSTSTIQLLPKMQKFTQDDVGKVYKYTVSETSEQKPGYTNDTTEYTIQISTSDDGSGTLTVSTRITGTNGTDITYEYTQSKQKAETGVAQVVFNNTYTSSTNTEGYDASVNLTGTKTLTNRPMVDGEFQFNVLSSGSVVSSGTNTADGIVTFTPINYTNDQLIQDHANGIASKEGNTYTYVYDVEEVTPGNGVSIVAGKFSVTVKVTDNGDGKLVTKVIYPEGGLAFENAYGQSSSAELKINGKKSLAENGTNHPDITDKFEFTITGSEGAPMPEKTTVRNDAAGNVDFGKIVYTMQNVFGDDGQQAIVEQETPVTEEQTTTEDGSVSEETEEVVGLTEQVETYSEKRQKTFTYEINESGSVPGVTNDTSKIITVTVTDNGDGTISVTSDTNGTFEFVNTYVPEKTDETSPTDSSVTIKKVLDGRDLKENEFTFVLSDENGNGVTATNDIDGNVIFPKMTFDKAGIYTYTISEVDDSKGGVAYDTTTYKAIATVTDDTSGKLKVEWKVTDSQGKEVKEITFNNNYTVQPTSLSLGATKVLEGRELADKEFLFVLTDEEGNIVEEAYNDATGKVEFSELVFDKAGTYNYTVSEKNTGAKGITYDESVYNIQVEVVDNGDGTLNMTTTTTKDGEVSSIVFRNKAEKDSVPEQPEKGDTSNTSTRTFAGLFTSLAVDAAALAGIATLLKKRNAKK